MTKKFYSDKDQLEFDYRDKLGDPGEYPYTRGIYPGMYIERLWTMRQYAGFAMARESNLRYRHLLEQG
jgi:methylmalonyl-CoA mutase N-terminal domain/subunit